MHRISSVKISNYRSCKSVALDLDVFTPLVGPNNAGKSTLLSAINWMLAPETLVASDFSELGSRVIVEVTVTGLTTSILSALTSEQKQKIEEYLNGDSLSARRICPAPGTTPAKTIVEVRDPAVAEASDAQAWKANPTGIWNAISALFPDPIRIGAMEDSAEDASKSKNTTTLGRLISEVAKTVVEEASQSYQLAAAEISDRLSADGHGRSESLKAFDADASAAVKDFFPGIDVKLHIPVPDLKDLIRGGTIIPYDAGVKREFTALGHGAQRAIQMALIRVLADRKLASSASTSTRVLLIDEPELFLHPTAVHSLRDALKSLTTVGYQVVVATHSPIFVESTAAESAVIVGKSPSSGTITRPTMRAAVKSAIASAPSQARALFSLTHASELLFADRVILAEGLTEKRLLPLLFDVVNGCSLRSKQVALVDLGGVENVPKSRAILEALGLQARIVADLDFAFRAASIAGWTYDCEAEVLHCRSLMPAIAASLGGSLDSNGLLQRTGTTTAAQQYEMLSQDASAANAIQTISEALLSKGIWIWRRGCIESHLGLTQKNERAWSAFAERIQREGVEAVCPDAEGTQKCMRWLAGGGA